MLAAARQKRGFGAPLAACGGGHIRVPEQRIQPGDGQPEHYEERACLSG
jgi:hypothetical protein